MPFLALLFLAALLASLMTPATADSPFDVTVEIIDPPTTASPGATLDTFEVEVAGTVSLNILDLVDADGTHPLTASVALLQEEAPETGAFTEESKTSVPVVSVGGDEGDVARATFDDIHLDEELEDGDYVLKVAITLGSNTLGSSETQLSVKANKPPVAAFSVVCDDLTLECEFKDESTDDGDIVKWEWTFGDGNSQTVPQPGQEAASGDVTHEYTEVPGDGGYTVTLKVTDDGGATDVKVVPAAITANDFSNDGYDYVEDCGDGCTFTDSKDRVNYTVEGPPGGGRTGVTFVFDADEEFRDACRAIEAVHSNTRILEPVTLVVPSGYEEGAFFTVTMVVPKQVINQDTNRGNFGVCFRDEAPADLGEGDPLYGIKGVTRLLSPCDDPLAPGSDPACVVSQNKSRNGTLRLVFQFPAVDPMFR